MLIFDRLGIKIYWTELPSLTPLRGAGRHLAETVGVRRLLREAFPEFDNLVVDHYQSGEPFLTLGSAEAAEAPASGRGSVNGNGKIVPRSMVERNSVRTDMPVLPEQISPFPPISISHCRRAVVLAIGEHGDRVGVDAETMDRGEQMIKAARFFLTEEELPVWGNGDAMSFWAWTIKEAAYKAAGIEGLTMKEIPLPVEIPMGNATHEGEISIRGKRFSVVQIDSPDPEVILMLVFCSAIVD